MIPLVDTQAPSIAGIITAFGTIITAVGAILIGYWQYKLALQVKATHKIVNQDKTDRDNFNAALIRALRSAGVDVPIDQSLATPPDHDPVEGERPPPMVMKEVRDDG